MRGARRRKKRGERMNRGGGWRDEGAGGEESDLFPAALTEGTTRCVTEVWSPIKQEPAELCRRSIREPPSATANQTAAFTNRDTS